MNREYTLDDLELYLLAVMEDRQPGLAAELLRAAAGAASFLFAGASWLRRRAYALRWLRSRRAPLPVISVGNLVAGGTGKTPFVGYLSRGLARQGRQVAVVARGYRAGKSGALNDELVMLSEQLPGLLVTAGANRLAGCRRAAEAGAQVAVLDDGFQHLALQRDLDILLIDATAPFGNGRLLPRGTLREPPECAARAEAVVLTRVDLAGRAQVGELRVWLSRLRPGAPVAECSFRPAALRPVAGGEGPTRNAEDLGGRRIGAFAGLADPRPFGRTLRALGAQVAYARRFRDHHRYVARDLEVVAAEAAEAGAELLVTTEKDAVKLRGLPPPALPAYSMSVEVEVGQGEDALWAEIGRALAARG